MRLSHILLLQELAVRLDGRLKDPSQRIVGHLGQASGVGMLDLSLFQGLDGAGRLGDHLIGFLRGAFEDFFEHASRGLPKAATAPVMHDEGEALPLALLRNEERIS